MSRFAHLSTHGARTPIHVSTVAVSLVAACLCGLAVAGCQKSTALVLPEGAPFVHRAVAEGRTADVKMLARGVDERGPFGWTPLHVAAIAGVPAAAKLLLARHANRNAIDEAGMTPLHWAARKGHAEVARLLIEGGAEVMSRNKFDMTPLHEAATVAVARLLLEAKASLDARDVDGMTPLHTASTKKLADFLIEKGANIHRRAKDGRTPMDMPPMVRARAKAKK